MKAWSYTALEAFETCPRRYQLTRLTRTVQEPQTEATIHGNAVHKALERAITGQEMLPHKYSQYRPLVQSCTRAEGEKVVEFKWALNDSFKPTTYFAKDVWVRGVIDFGVISKDQARVVDWKTGKPRPDSDQLKLFAAAAFAHWPVTRVKTGFAWLAHGRMMTEAYDRKQVHELWDTFLPRVARMAAAERRGEFPPNPSGLCKAHCPVPRALCQFSGRM